MKILLNNGNIAIVKKEKKILVIPIDPWSGDLMDHLKPLLLNKGRLKKLLNELDE